jgi:hypothetical protein
MQGNRKYKQSLFNKILIDKNIFVAQLVRYSEKHEQELGFKIDDDILGAVVNHSRDVQKSSIDKALILLNAYTGEKYTYNDLYELFNFK